MSECGIFSTVLMFLLVVFSFGAYYFFQKNIYPELDIINKTGGSEGFENADWWLPEKDIDPNFQKFLRKNNCGWNTGYDIQPNCPYDNDTSNDNWPIRDKCSDTSLDDDECYEVVPNIFGGGCKWMGKRYKYATDCKGTPNNNCCQKFDRRSGFVGGDGSWCARCKDPKQEDIDFCKAHTTLHCQNE